MRLKEIDSGLSQEIASVIAIDEHAHPLPLGMEPEPNMDKPIQPYDLSLPLRMRTNNPEYFDAWAALWGYEHRDYQLDHLQQLIKKKKGLITDHGQLHNVWVLDQVKIETMITMAYGPGPSEPAPRFRFCGFCDWLLWPFACKPAPTYPLIKAYFGVMEKMRKDVGCDGTPTSLKDYFNRLVLPVLHRYKQQGAVGLKFQTPYYRDLDFKDVSEVDASALFAHGIKDGGLSIPDHKALQDHIFRALVRLGGELGFVVQMHTGLGVRPSFDVTGSNPLLMEPVFHATPGTKFLLLHGGWPFDRETVALLAHDNVFTDCSCANLYKYARALCDQIRPALEWFPEKIMYGTDCYSDRSIGMLAGVPVRANPLSGWEEKAWLMDRTGREALALALTGMYRDGDITAQRASELVQMFMRENSIRLYGL